MPANATYGEIEIGLYRLQQDSYQAEVRVSDPESAAVISPARGVAPIATGELRALENEPARYGETLAAQLFRDEAVRSLYSRMKAVFESRGAALRLRLLIDAGAPELHAVRWELLHDPETKAPLTTSERMLFSRFMLSRDWRGIDHRPKQELKALIAVSSPTDGAEYGLALVPKTQEIERATSALAELRPAVAGQDEPLTLDTLMSALREGADLVYLVCHGQLDGVEPVLFLQNEAGKVATVSGSSLAERIAELRHPPRLIVMASCESGGREEHGSPEEAAAVAHSALAPRLAEAGVPAVIAMQGKVSMETVKLAMPVFFRELMKDGQIDRAMAVARGAIRDRRDSWMPALYLRLKSGCIWYEPGFSGVEKEEFEKWTGICNSVRQGHFLPILGPEFGEDLFGGTRELSSRLAESSGFPLAERDRTDLAKVTQYIATKVDIITAQDAVKNQYLRQLAERSEVDANTHPSLKDLLDRALGRHPDNPYAMLAGLPASIYVYAGADNVLSHALKRAGKSPETVVGAWRNLPNPRESEAAPRGSEESPAAQNGKPQLREPKPKNESPSPEAPWVYHVFGNFGQRDSLVVTEDDFFDYLIATSFYKLTPAKVRSRWAMSSLLFLGFRLDDWKFRVLFRLIMTLEGAKSGLTLLSHVGVQVNPDEHDLHDVKLAMKEMVRYFEESKSGVQVSIFWGSPADFLKALRRRLDESDGADPQPRVVVTEDDWIS